MTTAITRLGVTPMIMTVRCTSCEATFPVDPAKVPEPGVWARCSDCDGVFLVRKPPETPSQAPSGPDADLVAVLSEGAPAPSLGAAVADAPAADPVVDEATPERPEPSGDPDDGSEHAPAIPAQADPQRDGADEHVAAIPVSPTQTAEAPVPAQESAAHEKPSAPRPSPFGRQDPHDRARRLARVLVSDMIAYNPDQHARSLEAGTLADDFEEEIQKSWAEYLEQVGADIAESTPYFTEALNQVLAKGEPVF